MPSALQWAAARRCCLGRTVDDTDRPRGQRREGHEDPISTERHRAVRWGTRINTVPPDRQWSSIPTARYLPLATARFEERCTAENRVHCVAGPQGRRYSDARGPGSSKTPHGGRVVSSMRWAKLHAQSICVRACVSKWRTSLRQPGLSSQAADGFRLICRGGFMFELAGFSCVELSGRVPAFTVWARSEGVGVWRGHGGRRSRSMCRWGWYWRCCSGDVRRRGRPSAQSLGHVGVEVEAAVPRCRPTTGRGTTVRFSTPDRRGLRVFGPVSPRHPPGRCRWTRRLLAPTTTLGTSHAAQGHATRRTLRGPTGSCLVCAGSVR